MGWGQRTEINAKAKLNVERCPLNARSNMRCSILGDLKIKYYTAIDMPLQMSCLILEGFIQLCKEQLSSSMALSPASVPQQLPDLGQVSRSLSLSVLSSTTGQSNTLLRGGRKR